MSAPIMHPAKRRKFDESSSVLSKPFRSPMRVDGRMQGHQINHKAQTVPDRHAEVTYHRVNPHANVTEVECNSQSPLDSSSPIRKSPPILPTSPRAPAKDAEYLALQKQHSALLLQLSKLKQSLDIAQQALTIQCSNTDAELEALIRKWQLVSRKAAEELFASAKDRVNRMGGVGRWLERSHNNYARRWDEEEPVDKNDLTEGQVDRIEEQKQEVRPEKRRYGIGTAEVQVELDDDDDDEEEEEEEEESFTMDIMLQSLNVGLDLIGYDKQSQQWID